MKIRRTHTFAFLLAVSVVNGLAQSGNWTQNSTATQSWGTASNWSSSPTVPGGNGTAVNLNFDWGGSTARTIQLNGDRTVGTMIFGDGGASGHAALTLSAGTPSNSALVFNNNGTNATLTFQGSTSNNISASISLQDNLVISGTSAAIGGAISAGSAGQKTIFLSSAMDFGGILSDGNGTLALSRTSGGSTITLSGNNTFSGGVTSTTGILVISHNNALGTGNLTIGATFNTSGQTIGNNVIVASNVSAGTGGLTITGNVTNSGGSRNWSRSGTTDFSGNIFLSESSGSGRNFTIESSGVLSGVISNYDGVGGTAGGITFGQTATRLWQITQGNNTYTGSTSITNVNGVLEVVKLDIGGNASSIGASSNVTTNLVLSGKLRYIGESDAFTDRSFRLVSSGAGFESSGNGTLTISGATPDVNSSIRLLGLGGTNTGNNTFATRLTGTTTAGVNGVIKTGDGKWILTGNNTYQGATNINGGILEIGSANGISSNATATISFGGGTLRYSAANNSDYSARFSTAASQQYSVDTNSRDVTWASNLTSSGGTLAKTGAGNLTLSGNNTYSGGTTVTGGTLILAHNSAVGTGSVTMSGNASSGLRINAGISIANNVVFSNTNATSAVTRVVNNGSAFSMGTTGNFSSSFAGGQADTTAQILAGTSSSNTELIMAFSDTSLATNDSVRISDVFSLTGSGSDVIVLQLNVAGIDADNFLGWLSGSTWVNAVNGNVGSGSLAGAYTSSFADFVANNGGSFNATTMLGAYGVDVTGGSAWAVINHNSDFAVIPEPTTWALLAASLTTLMVFRRRRS
jgi:autotransporter-associated beta strand protein